MLVEIEVNEKGLIIHPVVSKKKKFIFLKETELLKGLTAKNAHADEIAQINPQKFGNDE